MQCQVPHAVSCHGPSVWWCVPQVYHTAVVELPGLNRVSHRTRKSERPDDPKWDQSFTFNVPLSRLNPSKVVSHETPSPTPASTPSKVVVCRKLVQPSCAEYYPLLPHVLQSGTVMPLWLSQRLRARVSLCDGAMAGEREGFRLGFQLVL